MPRPLLLHGRESTEEEIIRYVLDLIDSGITGTTAISKEIGKDVRTVRRYLIRMARMGKITLDPHSGRLEQTIAPPMDSQYTRLELGKFNQMPEISRWIRKCIARGVEPDGIMQMAGRVRNIFDTMKTHPRSVCYSRNTALEFWENYRIEYRKATGRTKVPQSYRTSFRNFLDAHDISFGHGMAKGYGLGSEHDAYKKYAGAHFKPSTIEKLTRMMLENGDDETFLATRLGIRTGARAGALVTMAWDRIYFDQRMSFENAEHQTVEFFKLEVHETKDKRGHIYLGKDGDWKKKFVPLEIYDILIQWKNKHPEFRKFVFFEDKGNDLLNRKKAYVVADRIARRLSNYYYPKIEDEVDPLTKELQEKRLSFLHCLYDLTSADRNNSVKLEEIIQKAGITHADAIPVGQYLHDEKLIGQFLYRKGKVTTFLKYTGSVTPKELESYRSTWNPKMPLSITHKGIKEIEQALNNPNESTEHFQSITTNNYINNSGIITSQNIQQGNRNSNQTIINNIQRNELQQIIDQIKENANDEHLTFEQKQRLELEIATLEIQSKSSLPMIQRIKESLLSAKEILDTISTGAIVVARIITWINGFQSC